jgi:hypothetical protein
MPTPIPTTDLTLGTHDANGTSPVIEGAKVSVITPQNEGGFELHHNGQQGSYGIETCVYEGLYDSLVPLLVGMPPGTWIATKGTTGINVQGGVFGMNLEHLPAGQGKATITMYKFNDATCSLDPYTQESGKPSEGKAPFAEFYSVQNARYDIPIERYLADDEDGVDYPDRIKFEKWVNEEDDEVKRNFAYSVIDEETEVSTSELLTGKTLELAQKVMNGQEVALRFWPVVTRTTLWWKACYPFIATPPTEPGTDNQRLGYICKPLSFYSLGAEWIKIQDDLEGEGPVLTRTECWMASDKWDVNLYGWGTDRWYFAGDKPEAEPPA